jgi:hypothetical protein
MTKAEVKAAFIARGEFTKYSHTQDQVWEYAFKLYETETKEHLNRHCGPCYAKVLKWLQR